MELTAVQALPPCPTRPMDAHKGTFGTLVVIGGCPTMIGAPAICASAALRGGVGLAKICTLASIMPAVLTIEPGATGLILAEQDEAQTLHDIDQADPMHQAVLAIGPGLGQSDSACALVKALLTGPRRMVLDADALNLLAKSGRARPLPGSAAVLTPHPGEFRRLAEPLDIRYSPTDPDTRVFAAASLARGHEAVVVLKGADTVVTDGHRYYVNRTGNPALATAGTGDVLTGLIGALIAQNMAPFEAGVLGVHLHGLAGNFWAQRRGLSGLTARDLARALPRAFHQYRRGS